MKGRSKLGLGGAAAGAVLLAWLLGGLSWLGRPGGGGGGDGDARVHLDSQPRSAVQPADREQPVEEDSPPVPSDVLHIVVEEDGYSLKETMRDGAIRYRPLTLDEVIELARQTPTHEGRARVQITMRRQAKGRYQQLLVQQLVDAGIDRSSIEGGEAVRLEEDHGR